VSGVLIAFTVVLLLPLFVGTWRTSLYGLACQGFLMGWIALPSGAHLTWDAAISVVDLIVLRAIAAPAALYTVLLEQNAARRNDVIAPNLLSWVVALALVLMAFRFADAVVPIEGEEQAIVAVAGSAFLLGFLVLATGTGPLSQMIGALRVENAIALFELSPGSHREPVGIRVGQTAVLLVTIVFFRRYLVRLSVEADATASTETPAL
jgi:hydrogenase-4 membrane subunit HyfE